MRLFLTGHTGFKGSWFTYCAAKSGVDVFGYALEPPVGGFFDSNDVASMCARHQIADVRDPATLADAVAAAEPDVVVHMAAQPLVRRSYLQPRETIETNVNGTFNVLEAAAANDVARVLVITSDKVYKSVESSEGHTEDAALGGRDPYSASKAMAEILVDSWASSFGREGSAFHTARAGNVIGGGDRGEDRLLPDILRAVSSGTAVSLRYPEAVRPWQHVLDVTSGYFAVLRQMVNSPTNESWNLGPDPADRMTVADVAQYAVDRWGRGSIAITQGEHPHEAQVLTISSGKAKSMLGWAPELSVREAVEWTVDWEIGALSDPDARATTDAQLTAYTNRAGTASLALTS